MSNISGGPPVLRLVFGSVRGFFCDFSVLLVSVTTILDVGSTGQDGVVALGSRFGWDGDKRSS